MERNYCMHCMAPLAEGQDACPVCGKTNGDIPQRFSAMAPGTILRGRYLLGRVLGQGGFGITYIGMDLVLLRKVAVKEFFPTGIVTRDHTVSNHLRWEHTEGPITQATGPESFLKEARKMAALENIPTMVQVKDMFQENATSYIVMEYIEGRTLKDKLRQEGRMSFSQCVELLRPLMRDLALVHKHGLIHRDISPDNIMLRPDGRVCLLDLGAAKDLNLKTAQSSMVVAKSGFSPLEQYSAGSTIGPWTDVYAMCATIYYCVAGKCISPAIERMEEDTLDLSPFTPAQQRVLDQGLKSWARDRIRDMDTLVQLLEEACGAQEEAAWEDIPATEHTPPTVVSRQETVRETIPAQHSARPVTEQISATLPMAPEEPKPEPKPEQEPAAPAKPRRKGTKILLAVAVVLVLAVAAAVFYAFPMDRTQTTIDGIVYTYYSVSGKWTATAVKGECPASVELVDSIRFHPVGMISYDAFRNSKTLEEITIPDSVTDIGRFTDATALKRIDLGRSVRTINSEAFRGCTSLEEIVLPPSVTVIYDSAFQDCTSLRRITLSEGLQRIEAQAFANCSSLTRIDLPESLWALEANAFSGCSSLERLELRGIGTEIPESAFAGMTALREVIICEGVETIGRRAFYGCASLVEVTLPDTLTGIGQEAFGFCISLERIRIPDSVRSIGDSAFYNCHALKKLEIGASCTADSIGVRFDRRK